MTFILLNLWCLSLCHDLYWSSLYYCYCYYWLTTTTPSDTSTTFICTNSFECTIILCCAVLCLVTHSCLTLCDPMDYSPPGSSVHGDSLGKKTGVGCYSLLQGIFLTQGSNPGLPYYRRILLLLRSPRILSWVVYPFSRGTSRPGNQTGFSCNVRGFFTNWATQEAPQQSYKAECNFYPPK